MKKIYAKPDISIEEVDMQSIICASGVSSIYGIDYGGIDEDGNLEPD